MANIGSFRGRVSVGLFSNVLMWLVVLAMLFVSYRFVRGLFPGRTPLASLSDSEEQAIANGSSSRLSNGDTYLSSVKWLYTELYGDSFLGWWKNSDEDLIGSYLLSIKPSEYLQLSNTYTLYKRDHGFWQIGALKDSLTTDLKDLFSIGNQQKYLSHLGIL